MATFLESSPDDEQLVDLARFVNKLKNKGKEEDDSYVKPIEELLAGSKHIEVLEIFLEEGQTILNSGTEKDVEGFYYVLLAHLRKLEVVAAKRLRAKLLATITSSKDDKVILRIRLLNNVYNILHGHKDISNSDRFELFMVLIKYCEATNHTEISLQYFKNIENRLKEWQLNTTQLRELCKAVRDAYKISNNSDRTLEWSIKYLSTFDGQEDAATEEAASAIIQAIKSPDLYRYDGLIEVSAIKKMAGSNKTANGKTVQLLKIFVNETLEAFTAFASENPDYFKAVGISQEDCIRKMRLLSLATLGGAASSEGIPYSLIAKILGIDEQDVEVWVIMAISENIIDAKMDQLKKVVLVSRCLQRVFTRAQWKVLSTKLDTWRSNLNVLLKTLQNSQRQGQLHYQQFQQQFNSQQKGEIDA